MDHLLPHVPDSPTSCQVAPGDQPGVIVLSGEFDAAAHDRVRAALASVVARDGPGRLGGPGGPGEVVVDVSAVRFMDAGTVRLLLQAWQSALDTGRRLRVSGAHGLVRLVIEAAGAAHQLLTPVEEDVAPPDDCLGDLLLSQLSTPGTAPIRTSSPDRGRATSHRQRAEDNQARILARVQQQIVDREVRATRRALLADLRRRLHADPQALSDEEFLAVADTPAVLTAILVAATIVGAADTCVLQLYDPVTATLHIARQHGCTWEFVSQFATVDAKQSVAYAIAAATGEPVIVDDITHSPLFAGQPLLDILLAAGSRAVQSHPLHDDDGQLLGVLSFHYRTTAPRHGNRELVAWCAARALTRMPYP